ncbi:AAA family ATPase [Rickettsiella massiliensis]|uniref:AAA family ATPase n=1 Tax=Rickettsiella massiliensis TaxID=676517 RepID=UPI00029A6640|nr:AAA family ATPase [Rickettsiella massiliensis]
MAREFVKESGVIQINSDVVRKRLHRIPLQASSHSALNQGIYSPQATQKTYQTLLDLADLILDSGFSVLVDATFLQCAQREAFQNLAKKHAVDFYILHCQMSEKILEKRVKQRHARCDTISEADLSILTEQQKIIEPLNEAEKKYTFLLTEEKASQKKALEKIFSNNHIEMLS